MTLLCAIHAASMLYIFVFEELTHINIATPNEIRYASTHSKMVSAYLLLRNSSKGKCISPELYASHQHDHDFTVTHTALKINARVTARRASKKINTLRYARGEEDCTNKSRTHHTTLSHHETTKFSQCGAGHAVLWWCPKLLLYGRPHNRPRCLFKRYTYIHTQTTLNNNQPRGVFVCACLFCGSLEWVISETRSSSVY